MNCRIIKDKTTGEEYLIPGCICVAHQISRTDMDDRQIIKEYCCCERKKQDKYEVLTRDEVFIRLEQIQKNIEKTKQQLQKLESELDCVKSEVFMLNTVEVFSMPPEEDA